MSGYVLFQMTQSFRRHLIDNHQFYVARSKRHVLAQFSNLDEMAEQAGTEWLEETAHLFNPDTDDPGAAFEDAYDHSIAAYQLLSDLRDNMRLAVIAGMFHAWEKELRDWLAAEMQHWHSGPDAYAAIWKANFPQILELLRDLGWDLPVDVISTLNRCRLIVNVYKHGPGDALGDLRKKYPEMLDETPGAWERESSARLYHARLQVTDGDLDAFSKAIVDFWNAAPENVSESQITVVPDWFGKAINSDRQNKKGAATPKDDG